MARLSSLQRQFYLNNTTGVSSKTPAGQLQRDYMVKYIITNEVGVVASQVHKAPFDELEIRWIRAWITTNGGTPQANNYLSSQWAKAVETLGKTVRHNQSSNMMTFFSNATS